MIIKFLLSSLIILSSIFNNFEAHAHIAQPSKSYKCATNAKSIYLQDIILLGNNHISFFLPSTYQFKYIHPFSLVSPSGKQLINIIPQFIDILQPIIRIYFRYPLEEKGTYKIIFTGIEKETNQQIDILGEFSYR